MDGQAQLDTFIDKFTPEVAVLTRALIDKMKGRVPGATIMVYDNYNALAIGFGPNDKASLAVLSLAVMPRWVTLCFLFGVGLPDPVPAMVRLIPAASHAVRIVRLYPSGAAWLLKMSARDGRTGRGSRFANFFKSTKFRSTCTCSGATPSSRINRSAHTSSTAT